MDRAEKVAQAGTPATTSRNCPVSPMGSLAAVLPLVEYAISPVAVKS